MSRTRRFTILWTMWMAGGGLVAAVIAYAVTDEWRWALAVLLVSGVVLNTIGQVVTRPAGAVASSRRARSGERPGIPSSGHRPPDR